MKRYIISIIAAFAVMFGITFTASAANASDTSSIPPTSGSTITSTSSSSSVDEAKVTSSAHAGGTVTSKTLARVIATGTPKAQQTKCFTIKKKASYYTSYKNYKGQTAWFWKSYPKGKKFCKQGSTVRDPNCHNEVKIGVPKSKKPKGIVVTGKVKFIVSFKFVAKASAKVTATATAKAEAWCRNEWTSATATATASSSADAYAYAEASATTQAAAEAAAKGSAKKLSLSTEFKSTVEVKAKAEAEAKATADATAKVTCSNGPSTPPSTPPGSIIEITTPNHVIWNNSRTFNVQGIVPDGKGTLRVSSNIGTIAASDKSIDLASRVNAKGEFNFTITYTAPDEGSSDTLTFDLYNASGKKDDSKSVIVPLKAPPVDPM